MATGDKLQPTWCEGYDVGYKDGKAKYSTPLADLVAAAPDLIEIITDNDDIEANIETWAQISIRRRVLREAVKRARKIMKEE